MTAPLTKLATARRMSTAALAATVAMLAVGCSAQTASPTTTAVAGASQAAYADCLREHGLVIEEYTAEDGSTRVRPDKHKNEMKAIEDATEACAALAPTDESTAASLDAELLAAQQRYAACVRDHGVAQFPDPDPATGDFTMDEALAAQLKSDPAMLRAMDACRSVLPGGTEPGTVGG